MDAPATPPDNWRSAAEVYVTEAAERYDVPAQLIKAILKQEGGWPGARIGPNKSNKTYDLGPMQINTHWVDSPSDQLVKLGIDEQTLTDDVRTNIHVGAWILATEYARFGDWTKAIRAYNVGSPAVMRSDKTGIGYARKVITYWHRFYEQAANKNDALASN